MNVLQRIESDPSFLAGVIDHTLLRPDTTRGEIEKLCQEALEQGFYAVCVNPSWVRAASGQLTGTRAVVCSVVGFPLGATPPEVKAAEAATAVEDGAGELDMVINIGALKSGDLTTIEKEVRSVIEVARGVPLKLILEVGLLTREEIAEACRLAAGNGARFVKTSTGFGPRGVTVEDLRLLRTLAGPKMGVKASGGIRDARTALAMVKAGADRIGTSSGVKIMEELRSGGSLAG